MHDSGKFAKKLIMVGDNDIKAVLERLDRLTKEESQLTATQTMEVVYGLFKNMKVVMDGTETLLNISFNVPIACLLDGKSSINNLQQALGTISLHL